MVKLPAESFAAGFLRENVKNKAYWVQFLTVLACLLFLLGQLALMSSWDWQQSDFAPETDV